MSVAKLYKYSKKVSPESDISNYTSIKSVLMQDIYTKVNEIAKTEKHVVIIGEIGSGKTEFAHLIHSLSNRSSGPFQTFHCLDIDDYEYKKAFWEQLHFEEEHIVIRYELLERVGYGILHLARFSDLKESLMVNIIQSFIKGCNQLFRYNKNAIPRLLLSINMENYQQIKRTQTWEKILDLLNPIAIMVPPLRERKEDIPLMIEEFINEIKKNGTEWDQLEITDEAVSACSLYDWPGNIRQLKNAIHQGAILSHGQKIQKRHLPFSMSWNLPHPAGKYI